MVPLFWLSFWYKKIIEHSGIVKNFKAGNLILNSKRFILHNMVPKNVSINIPLLLDIPKFTIHEIEKTKSIARARIHMEGAIQRLKCCKILTFILKSLCEHLNYVFQLCAALTNFQNSLIKVGKYYISEQEELY